MSEERRRRPDADASRFFLGQAQGHQPLEQDHHEMPAAHARVEGFDGSQTVPVWIIFISRARRSGYFPVWILFKTRARRSGYLLVFISRAGRSGYYPAPMPASQLGFIRILPDIGDLKAVFLC